MSVVSPTITSGGEPMAQTYELLSIDITREINRIPSARLMLIDGDAAQQRFEISDAPFFEPSKEIKIQLRYESEGEDVTVFKGLVTRHGVQLDSRGSVLTVELRDAAVKLTRTRKSTVHRKQTDDKIIEKMITDGGLEKGELTAAGPEHAEIVQYYCTDWDFMLSRAEVTGRVIVAEDGVLSLKPIEIVGDPKHVFEFGISEIHDFEIEADAGQQYGGVESVGWDIKEQKLTKPSRADDFALQQGNLDGARIAQSLGADTCVLTAPTQLVPDELQAWSDATMTKTRMSMLRGRFSVPGLPDIRLLDVMEIAGVGDRFNGKTLVTGIRHEIAAGGWQTQVQFGMSARWFAREDEIVDTPAAGLLPAVNGLQIGVVDKFEEDPDKQYRLKVILPGVDEQEGAVWARLASPDAGAERGYFFRPEKGDEVVVGFLNDDPRQPVVLGSLYSSKNAPPEDLAKLTKDNIHKGVVSRSGVSILIDDKDRILKILTSDKQLIALDEKAKSIEITDTNKNKVALKDGVIEITAAKALKVSADGDVQIKGKNIKLEAKSKVEVKGSKVDVK